MAKISKSFRLSEQAQAYLRQLVSQTGSSETAIIEMSLARFSKFMQGEIPYIEPDIPEPEFPENWEDADMPVLRDFAQPAQNGKKRKRH